MIISLLTFLLSLVAAGQESSTVQRGTWTATAGPAATQVMRGNWSAETSSGTPNAARGSWTLLNASNEVVLEGTWSAAKSSGGGWQGTWSARVVTRLPSGRAAQGRMYSGTWQATTDMKGTTFAEMLLQTLDEQIAGSWRSGGLSGNWWLKSSRR